MRGLEREEREKGGGRERKRSKGEKWEKKGEKSNEKVREDGRGNRKR